RGDRAEDHSLDPALPLSPGEDHLESLPEGPLDERCRHVTGGEHIHVKIHFYLAELGAPFLQQRLEAGATLVDGAALLRLNDVDCTEYRPLLGRRGHTVQPTVPGDGIVEGAVPVRGKVRGHAHPRDREGDETAQGETGNPAGPENLVGGRTEKLRMDIRAAVGAENDEVGFDLDGPRQDDLA